LIITDANLKKGLDILAAAIRDICAKEAEMPEETDYFDNVQHVEPELISLAS
jgi:diaminobutyrate-2-oxoglutarate transaminase